jgi:hypothetical protein
MQRVRVIDEERASRPHRHDDGRGSGFAQLLGLAFRFALAGQRTGFVLIGDEEIDLREDVCEQVERDAIVARGNDDVEDRPDAGSSRRSVEIAERRAVQPGKNEVAADVERVGVLDERSVDVCDAEVGVRAQRVDEAPIFADHRQGDRLRGRVSRRAAETASVDPPLAQVPLEEVAEDVIPDLAGDGGVDAQAGEDDGGVCRAPARREQEIAGRAELAGGREACERWDEKIGHDDPRTDDGRARHWRRHSGNTKAKGPQLRAFRLAGEDLNLLHYASGGVTWPML